MATSKTCRARKTSSIPAKVITLLLFFHFDALESHMMDSLFPHASWIHHKNGLTRNYKYFPSFQENREQSAPMTNNEINDINNDVSCVGKMCSNDNECCYGYSCVSYLNSNGICRHLSHESESCVADHDCHAGLRCFRGYNFKMVCRRLTTYKKRLAEECKTSSECDVLSNLCCKIVRHQRKAARRMCYFYSDPTTCIGSLKEADKIESSNAYNSIERPFQARTG